jgi:hypothetical protein
MPKKKKTAKTKGDPKAAIAAAVKALATTQKKLEMELRNVKEYRRRLLWHDPWGP